MEILKRYQNKSAQTQEYMQILCDSIQQEYGQIDGPYLLSLDLISDNYEILLKAKEDIEKNGLKQTDSQGRPSKNDALQIFNNAQSMITKLLNNFGKTPMSKSKIKHLDTDITDPADEIFND